MMDWQDFGTRLTSWVPKEEAQQIYAEYCDLSNTREDVAAKHDLTVGQLYFLFRLHGFPKQERRQAQRRAKESKRNEAGKSV